MSTRKITVYATKGQQMKTIDSASGVWSELRGELSKGMILAADDGEKVAVLTIDKEIQNNAQIK